MPKRFTDMNSITKDFFTLMNTVKALNPQATIVICGSIPRLWDWAWSREFSLELNDFLQEWCCAQVKDGNRAIFAPSFKVFLKEWQAVAWPLQVGWGAFIHGRLACSGLNSLRLQSWKRRSLEASACGTSCPLCSLSQGQREPHNFLVGIWKCKGM